MNLVAYVSSSESREIHAFQMDAQTGTLELIEVTEVPGPGAASRGNMPLAICRSTGVLYAEVRTEPFPLSAFRITPGTGRLRLMETVELAAPMAYLSLSNDGQFMLGASYQHGLLSVNRVVSDGRVETPCAQTLQTPPKAHCVLQAPFGNHVYATSVDGEAILTYRFDEANGRLEPAIQPSTPTPAGAGPRHLAFHPKLDVLYCINEHAGSLGAYTVDRATGALTPLQYESLVPPGFSGNAMGADLHLTPDAAILYASVRKTDTISAFHVDPTNGTLSRAATSTVEPFPRGFAIDPNGRFLLCAGQQSNAVAVYAIDRATGGLTLVGRYAVGNRPSWIEIIDPFFSSIHETYSPSHRRVA